ncbi:MAG: amidase family protein [Methylocella sp.]
MNAIAQKDAASAWRAAARANAHAARGRPLEGLPETIKHRFEVAGMLISAGAPPLRRYTPNEDASAARRRRKAGAIRWARPIFPFSPAASRPAIAIAGQSPIRARVRPWSIADTGAISI